MKPKAAPPYCTSGRTSVRGGRHVLTPGSVRARPALPGAGRGTMRLGGGLAPETAESPDRPTERRETFRAIEPSTRRRAKRGGGEEKRMEREKNGRERERASVWLGPQVYLSRQTGQQQYHTTPIAFHNTDI